MKKSIMYKAILPIVILVLLNINIDAIAQSTNAARDVTISTPQMLPIKDRGGSIPQLPPNFRPNTPSNPSPSNGAVYQPTNLTLSWSGGDPNGDTVTYTVYLDTSSNPTTQRCSGTSTSCSISGLSYSTIYYWKVVASDGKASAINDPVWNFTTQTLLLPVQPYPKKPLPRLPLENLTPIYNTQIKVSTNIESATFTISGHATYFGSGKSWNQSNAPPGTYTITYGSVGIHNTPPSETKTLYNGESIVFSGYYLASCEEKKRASDSIDYWDGYILLIQNVNPANWEVSIELQLDNRTIGNRVLKKNESYEIKKYNKRSFNFTAIDIYHDTTGDYVVYAICRPMMGSAHLNSNLNVASIPLGADILIDGVYVGKTPKKIAILDLEEHSLRLELNEYKVEDTTFKFELDDTNKDKDISITLSQIQPTPTATPELTLVPQTPSPLTPAPSPTLVPQTTSPLTPASSPTLVPQTPSPLTPAPSPTLVPQTPTETPGFLATSFVLAIFCVYLILKKRHQ